jgi:hypothetical protein
MTKKLRFTMFFMLASMFSVLVGCGGCDKSSKAESGSGETENRLKESEKNDTPSAEEQSLTETELLSSGENESTYYRRTGEDITALIKQEAIFLGMIGDENRKMGIALLSLVRTDDKLYEVTGKSKVRDNICDFRGVMEVQSAEVGITTYDSTEYFAGRIAGKYLFEEDRNQASTGVFEGTFEILWNNENLPTYFTSIAHGEVEFNVGATFTGTWKSYRTGASRKACWSNLWVCKPCCINDGQELWVDESNRSSGWALEIDRDKYLRENWDWKYATEKIKEHPEYLGWHEWWK